MKLFSNKLLSILFITIVLIFTSACNDRLYPLLNEGLIMTPPKESGAFVIKTDGTKILGDKVVIEIPGKLHLDDKQYSHNEIKAYQWGNLYYIRHKGHYLQRIIEGKLNLYEAGHDGTAATSYYARKGENGEVKHLLALEDLAELVADCPAIHTKLNHTYSEMKELCKKNRTYISEAILGYNKTCGQ